MGYIDEENANAYSMEQQQKTFTQDDINRIIDKNHAKTQKKISEMEAKLLQKDGELSHLSEISKLLGEFGGLGGTPGEQVKCLKQFYGMTASQAENVVKANTTTKNSDDDSLTYMKAQKAATRMQDNDVIDGFEQLSKKSAKQRTDAEDAMLDVLAERYCRIKFNQNIAKANSWFTKEYPDEDFKQLIGDDDFIDFAQGSSLPLEDIIKKYQRYVGKNPRTVTTGSVKSTPTSKVKDFYTSSEVDKLTDKNLENPKVWEAVRKSMTKWN